MNETSDGMPGLDEAERFGLEGGVLHCPEDMNRFSPRDLRDWCDRLLEAEVKDLVMLFQLSGFDQVFNVVEGDEE